MRFLNRRTTNDFSVRLSSLLAALAFAGLWVPISAAECEPGVYGGDRDSFVIIGAALAPPTGGRRYLFPDGRRGSTADRNALVTCEANVASVLLAEGRQVNWPRLDTIETDASFSSASTTLAGQLVEPAGAPDPLRPLVVMIHGSESTAAIGNIYAYMLAAQGISVFVYDKRGTGSSGGQFTMNFELLADDAVAALVQARSMANGRFGRAGYFGGSQGGWVAPLAATRSPADFVAVGFGLVISPLEEDRAQLLDEARRMHLDAADFAKIERLADATATLRLSNFRHGFEQLAAIREEIGDVAWASSIEGEGTGDILRMSDADLRRIGRARFDNVELIWDYDAQTTLSKLDIPLLWVMAEEDREAPIEATKSLLEKQIRAGQSIDAYVFPNTDHGMVEFETSADGTRRTKRITDGYLTLLADWIKGEISKNYGESTKLN